MSDLKFPVMTPNSNRGNVSSARGDGSKNLSKR